MLNPYQFVREAAGELRRVTWLPRKQMIASTLVVMLLVMIVSLYIGLVDMVVSQIFGIFIRI